MDGYTYIDHHSWDAYNECADFDTHIPLYGERFGRRPQRFFADKIYMTKENRRKLRDLGIQCMGARLGRPPKVKPQEQIDNERIGNSLRNEVEATFGTSKRVYRADNIRAKLPGTAECWTGMCYFVKNLTNSLRGLCRVLTEKLPSMRILGIIGLAFGELARKILPLYCSEAKNADCLRRLVQRTLNKFLRFACHISLFCTNFAMDKADTPASSVLNGTRFDVNLTKQGHAF